MRRDEAFIFHSTLIVRLCPPIEPHTRTQVALNEWQQHASVKLAIAEAYRRASAASHVSAPRCVRVLDRGSLAAGEPDESTRSAAAFGYESEAAFNRAFKRHVGISPGAVRRAR